MPRVEGDEQQSDASEMRPRHLEAKYEQDDEEQPEDVAEVSDLPAGNDAGEWSQHHILLINIYCRFYKDSRVTVVSIKQYKKTNINVLHSILTLLLELAFHFYEEAKTFVVKSII